MILFPAIDLKDGQCVRLKLGDMEQATVFNDDPAAQAKSFEDQGFDYLHVVDLNGAFAGESVNGTAVEAILKSVKFPVQLGGGIRNLGHIESWLEKGLARVILGTVAVRDPALVGDRPTGAGRCRIRHARRASRPCDVPQLRSRPGIAVGLYPGAAAGSPGFHLGRHR